MGVYGYASNSGAGFNFGGYFAAAGTNGTGIYGQAPKTGILGYADGATGKGVFGSADGANGSGVYGQASQATGYAGYFKGGRGISVEGNAFITGEVTATAFHGDGSDLSNVNTTIADNAITTAKITAEAVTNGKIASNAITSAKITAEAVTSGKIASNAVTTVKITDGAITEPKLSITNEATAGKYLSWNGNYMEWLAVSGGSTAEVDNETIGLNASGSLEVKNSAITIGKIATTNIATGEKYLKYTGSNLMWATVSGGGSTSREPDYITIGLTDVYASLEVLDAAITNAKIGPAAVTADKLADGSITATKITDEAVTSGKIASNAITSEKITNEAVTAAKIAAGAVTSSKLASNAAVLSIATTGSSELTGAVELKPGTNITLTQTGNTIEVSASGGGSGTVTSISTGTGLTGGPITVSGIISVESGGIGATQLADSAVTSGKLASDINIVTTGTVSSTANVAERGAVSGLNPNSQGAGLYGEGGVGIYAKTISDNYYSGMFSGGVGISVEGGIGATGIATAAAFSGSGAGLTNIPATSIADGSITGAKLASDINVITTGVVTSTANVAQAGAVSGLNSNAEGAGLFGEGSVGVYAHSTGSSGNAYSGWFRGGVGVSVEGGLGATGIVTAAAFSGNGSGLTNVPATSLADGSIANAKLAGSITGDKLAFNIGINTTGTITAGAISGTINADTVDGFHATSEAAANKLLALNSNKQFILSNNIMSPYIPLIDVNVDGVDAPLGMRVRTAGIYGIAISGEATNTDANTNYGGMFSAAASNGRGVYGIASGDYGIGVYGAATKNSVQTNPNYGGYFLSNGFYGVGVYAEQSGGDGVAVYGKTTSGSGQSIAGKFVNQSGDANSAGISVEAVNKGGFFHASANSGTGIQSYGGNYGGYFESTYGESVTKGIYAKTNSPDGYAGYFEGGEGVYVSGSLESTGRITAVSFTGSGAGLTNIPATSIADGSITGAKLASNINVVTTGNVSSTASVADAGAVTGLNPNANGAGLYGEGKVGVYAKSTGNYYSGMFVGGAGVSVEGGLGVTGIVTAAAFSGNGSGLTGITAETLAPDINVVTTGNVSSTASVAYAGAVTGLNPNANGAGLYGEGKVGVYAKSTGNYYSGMFVGGTGVSVEGGLGVTGIVTAAAFSGSVNADTVDGFHASATATDNNLLPLNDNGQFELVKSYGGALIVVSNGHDNGIGVQGEGGAYGGEFSALSADGIGVYGTSPSYGGYFHSTGATGQGVYAKADGADGVGVSGEAIGANGVGVSGIASATGSVLNYGGFFVAKGDAGEGVSGNATGADGQGVSGFATGANGIAVYGQTIQDAGYAGYFKGGKGISVEGNAFVTGILTAGAFETTGIISSSASAVMAVTGITSDNNGICVYGHATSHAMSSYNTGGEFIADGSNATGVHGETTYNGYGGFFTTPIGTGVYGRSYTGGYGVRGEAQGSSVGGYFTSTGSNGIYVNTISSNSYSGYFTGGLGLASTGTIEVTGASGISIVIDNAFTPSGTTDVRGKTGQICWDEDYIYVKTAAGWRRTQYGATW